MQILIILLMFIKICETIDCTCAQCSFEDLPENCTYINGHILIGLESQMPPYEMTEFKLSTVESIKGCITIANSGFTNLNFLENLEEIEYSEEGPAATCKTYLNTITIAKNSLLRQISALKSLKILNSTVSEYSIYLVENPSLCITEEELEHLSSFQKFYAPHFQICSSEKTYCRLESLEYFNDSSLPENCQILTNSIFINGTSSENSTFQERILSIEQIYGNIIIMNSNLETLNFENLWRIYSFYRDLPVILFHENYNLSEISFDNLKLIENSNDTVLSIYSTPNIFSLSESTCETLKAFGNISFDDVDPCWQKKEEETEEEVEADSSDQQLFLVENFGNCRKFDMLIWIVVLLLF